MQRAQVFNKYEGMLFTLEHTLYTGKNIHSYALQITL